MSSPHVGDIGTPFTLTVYKQDSEIFDLSACTGKYIIFIKPDTSKVTTNATFTTDGTDGKVYYTAGSGLLDIVGDWKIQGHFVFSNGEWFTDQKGFIVLSNN